MKKISVAEFIVKKIESWKVKDVPIFQGGAIMNVLSEIGKSKKIKYYCPYHEQALAMAVDAYSRLTGFGVGLVTSGPGATNLLTGVACSYYDSIPVMFFSGQVGQFHLTGNRKVRQRGFQETDVVSIFKPVTKFAYQLTKPEEINYILEKAYYLANSGRPGPVLIDLPFNIQKSMINPSNLTSFKIKIKKNDNKKTDIDKLQNLLNKSQKPLFICGGGVRISQQIQNFLKLVTKKNIPFVTTWPAQDITNSDNKLYFGSIGRHAHLSACNLSKNADLIITFGVRFSPKISNFFTKTTKVISIDIDNNELTQGLINPYLKLNIDLKNFFSNLNLRKIRKFKNKNWEDECKKEKNSNFKNFIEYKNKVNKNYVNPYLFLESFSKEVPDKSILITDAGCNLTYFMQAFISKKNQRIISAWGNSPMGYSVAAGIGAKIAKKSKKVISCIGDGSFLINLQELQFIKENKINLKIVVFDNKIFGNTFIGCNEYKIKNVGNDRKGGYYPPDIKKISECFSIKYFYLKSNDNQKSTIKKFLDSTQSSILHINIHPNHPLIEHQSN
jgi:acetolactate synthase-1/2/3 large subunit